MAQAKVDSIYKLIKGGASFEDQARLVSEDKTTAMIGGNVGFFGINQYESNFEDAAFSLEKMATSLSPLRPASDGISSKGFERKKNFHTKEPRKIQSEITRDSRFKEAQGSLIEKLK